MTPGYFISRLFSRSNIFLLLALLLLAIALMIRPLTLPTQVYTLQVAFDISQSMNVRDIEQGQTLVSRLEYAKRAARELLHELPCGSKIGWSVFTGRRTLTLITPLDVCEHYAGLLLSLDEIGGEMRWSNGSIIGKGIHQIMRAAHETNNATTVVFITDGHEAPPLEIGQRGMPNTDKFDVNGLIIGVGGNTPMAIPKTDSDGRAIGFWQANDVVQRVGLPSGSSHEELSRRDDKHLQKLARLTNLNYLPMNTTQELVNAIVASGFSQSQQSSRDVRWVPAVLALLLLCWRFLPRWIDWKNTGKYQTIS